MSNAQWETISNQAVAAAGVVYFLALLAHLVQWSALRKVPVGSVARRATGAVGAAARRAIAGESPRGPLSPCWSASRRT